jgi:hypothetical protein
VQKRVAELLTRCGSNGSVLPPTQLYNEGWMLRLVLDWFDRNRALAHQLSFLPESRWYSEALLPSRFLPQRRGDKRAESFTHADGIVGHFSIAPGERGEARLLSQPKQFVVTEAKLGSSLSAGTKNAPEYDQAARNVACMAHMLHGADLTTVERLGFYVIAPDSQIKAGVFGDLVTKESICRKVDGRVAMYPDLRDTWFRDTFEPVLNRVDLSLLSWESILGVLPKDEESDGIREFYRLCKQFNPARVERSNAANDPKTESGTIRRALETEGSKVFQHVLGK